MHPGQDVLHYLSGATAREWLIGNGLGGSASGTAAGAHTRRTHALLVSATPAGHLSTALLKLDERVQVGSESFELSSNFVRPSPPAEEVEIRPAGHLMLESFRGEPWPSWRWRAGGVTLEKSVFMVHGHHAVVVSYRHIEGPPAHVTVSPLIAARDPGQLQHGDAPLRGVTQGVPGRVRIESLPGSPTLTLWHSGTFLPARVWQRGLTYPADPRAESPTPARGKKARTPEEPSEDAFVPGYLECELPVGGAFHVVAATEDDLFRVLAVEGRLGAPPPRTIAECVEMLEREEMERRSHWKSTAIFGADFTARQAATAHGGPGEEIARRPAALIDESDVWVSRLAATLSDGLIVRGGRTTLLSALPGGSERGAETLRAVPALITLRAFEPAREILRGYVDNLNEGLIPETFEPTEGRPCFGDAAPALWLVHAAELFARRSEDLDLVRDTLYPAVDSIMQAYRSGTRAGIKVRPDGLLSAGEGEAASRRADVNALWFHALVAAAQLARLAGRKEGGAFYLAWAREHQKRVLESLWNEDHGCLYEAATDSGFHSGLTPGQILAVSLSPPLLPPPLAERLVAKVERELFTPLGLRETPAANTASPAWLGPFITAYLRVHQRSAAAQVKVRGWLETLRAELDSTSAGHVPERFPAPRRGDAAARRGDAAVIQQPQPVSVLAAAELLRAWVEDVDRAEEPAGVA